MTGWKRFFAVALTASFILYVVIYSSDFSLTTFSPHPHVFQSAHPRSFNLTGDKFLPPVIFHPQGGIGNQLFQYAASYALAKRRNSKMYFCLPYEWNNSVPTTSDFKQLDRTYTLNIFSIPHDNIIMSKRFTSCNLTDLLKETKTSAVHFTLEDDILADNLPEDKIIYVRSPFESEIFFREYKDEILDLLTLSVDEKYGKYLSEIVDQLAIKESESVSVHFRRSDFGHFGKWNLILPWAYQKKAMATIQKTLAETQKKENVTFFVFSDDIEAVKKEFKKIEKDFKKIVYVSNKKFSRITDFLLMTLCKHNIIANSTFSWWAAYLNKNSNKIVIGPMPKYKDNWYKVKVSKSEFVRQIYDGKLTYPPEWITVNPFNR